MKRCPSCNQTFEEDWLSYCTQDGTTLVDDAVAPTIVAPAASAAPPVENVATNNPGVGLATDAAPPAVAAPVWQPPPPPPTYPQAQNKGLATASMIFGIIGITCFGPIFGILGIVLGAIALSQIKKDPTSVGGRQQALTGIICGSVSIVVSALVFIFYLFMFVLASTNR